MDTLFSKIYELNPCFKGRIKRVEKVGRIGEREGGGRGDATKKCESVMELATTGLWFIARRHGTWRRAKRQDLWCRARCHGPRCQASAMSPSHRHPRHPLPLISTPRPTASRRVTLAPWVTVPSPGSKIEFRRPSCINVSSIFKPLMDQRDRHYRC